MAGKDSRYSGSWPPDFTTAPGPKPASRPGDRWHRRVWSRFNTENIRALAFLGTVVLLVGGAIAFDVWEKASDDRKPGAHPEQVDDYCQEWAPMPDATPYEGKGPHRFVISKDEDIDPMLSSGSDSSFQSVPDDWKAADPEAAELVACIDIVLVDSIAECDFILGEGEGIDDDRRVTGELHSAEYTFQIRSATTGKLLDEVTEFADDETCPTGFGVYESEPIQAPASLADGVAQEILEPWVTKTVG